MSTDWKRKLPRDWRTTVVAPHLIERHADTPARATRHKGYDTHGCLCYYAHSYALTHPVENEEDGCFEEEHYHEEVAAWRLEDGRWLVCRYRGGRQGACGERAQAARYAVEAQAPV